MFLRGIEDEEFGPELLVALTRGYRSSSKQQMEDKYAFAIQEVNTWVEYCNQAINKGGRMLQTGGKYGG